MPIEYRDFFPELVKKGTFLASNQYAMLSTTVARANEWIAASGVRIINVETVLLPNIENETEASKTDAQTSGEIHSDWFQVVRIWHETPTPPGS